MQDRHPATKANIRFYERLWSASRLRRPERFNTWPLVSCLAGGVRERLEVGPGLCPRLPIEGTHFLDASPTVVERLNAAGGIAREGDATHLPYHDGQFDLAAAFDIIEHLPDDSTALTELARVLVEGGVLILSLPLHPHRWTDFDAVVGHCRRYRPDELTERLDAHELEVERSAVYGMQPGNSRLMSLAAWFMKRHPALAAAWYDRFLLPLALRLQKPLQIQDGAIEMARVDEVLLVCRRRPLTPRAREEGAAG